MPSGISTSSVTVGSSRIQSCILVCRCPTRETIFAPKISATIATLLTPVRKFLSDRQPATAIIVTVTAGLGQSIILGGISALGYIYPEGGVEQVIQQPESIRIFFIVCFVGIPMLGYLLGALLQKFFDVEEKMPEIQADIIARHRAAVEAAGGVYISPEEKAARELEGQERISEQKRIEELKAKCAKKGLSFAEEEAKYQAKLKAKQDKANAKKKK